MIRLLCCRIAVVLTVGLIVPRTFSEEVALLRQDRYPSNNDFGLSQLMRLILIKTMKALYRGGWCREDEWLDVCRHFVNRQRRGAPP